MDTNCCIQPDDLATADKADEFTERQYLWALVCQSQRIIELLTPPEAP